MLTDFKPREWTEEHYYELAFDDGRNNGFGFPCDENGNLPPDLNPAAIANYHYALEHPEKFTRYNKVVRYTRRYKTNATGVCACGQMIELCNEYLGACACPNCGRWYNLFGQELNPPDTWASGDDW